MINLKAFLLINTRTLHFAWLVVLLFGINAPIKALAADEEILVTKKVDANSLATEVSTRPVPYVKTDGEIRVLPRTRPDRQYQLYIGLPESYATNSNQTYPVIFATDGYWNFSTIRSLYWALRYDKTLPEAIVVGIGYVGENLDYDSLRNDDLNSPLQWRNMWVEGMQTGQADQFLNVIETLAIPMLEQEYRADPSRRILIGGSLGGAFTLYVLYTKPSLFHAYVAASPAIAPVWQYEEAFARTGKTIDARLFMTIGALESNTYQNEVVLFDQKISTRSYLKNGYAFRYIQGLRHSGSIMNGFIEGLQYAFEPIAPERGQAAELSPDFAQGFFVIHFMSSPDFEDESQWNSAQKKAMQLHRQRLDQLVAEKKILTAARTPDGSDPVFSTVAMLARDKAETEKLAATDPAVVAGYMTFKVISLSEKP